MSALGYLQSNVDNEKSKLYEYANAGLRANLKPQIFNGHNYN